MKNTITSSQQLSEYCKLEEEYATKIDEVSEVFKMGISPYIAGMLGHEAIFRQFVPDSRELIHISGLSEDPLLEKKNSPVKRLVHKYPDKVAVFASDFCFAYCRHCTRKNTVINGGGIIKDHEIDDIIDYLQKTPEVNDVLITGGDPFVLGDEQLEKLISRIRSVPHVSTIRLGTRAIVAAPMRITEDLADMLSKYHPLWVHVQFNHPCEITEMSKKACELLLSRGIPLNNQSVLLKGINDDEQTIKELLLSLIKMRIRPYYLYQCDSVKGVGHFISDVECGMNIIKNLQGTISGYAIPRFVIDVCGNGGKIVAEYSNLVRREEDRLILRSYCMDECTYKYINSEGR